MSCSCLFRNGSTVAIYRLNFTNANKMPRDAEEVLNKLRALVQNGTLGPFELDQNAPVCLVDIGTGQCQDVSSAMMSSSMSSSAIAFESSSDFMMSSFDSSVSLQPSDSSQVGLISSSSMIPDVSLSPSAEMSSDLIAPSSVVSSEDFLSSSALITAPLVVESSMRITNVDYTENMANKTSSDFLNFQEAFCSNVSCLFLSNQSRCINHINLHSVQMSCHK